MSDLPYLQNEQPGPSVYSRNARNWTNHALVIGLLALALSPLVLTLSFLIPAVAIRWFGAGAGSTSSIAAVQRHRQRRTPFQDDEVQQSPVSGTPTTTEVSDDRHLAFKLMPVAFVLLSAALGLLLWGISRASTTNLLAQLAARPVIGDGPEREASRALEAMAAAIGVPPPKLYVIHCSFPTAFSAEIDNQNAMIAVTSGALDLLESRELNALLTHELIHVANRDSRLDAILAALALVASYPFKIFKRQFSPGSKGSIRGKIAMLELGLSPLGLYIFFVLPFFNFVVRMLVLRNREFRSDFNAVTLMGSPHGLVYALGKIGGITTNLGKTTVSSMPGQTMIAERIESVMNLYETCTFPDLAGAIAKGKQWVDDHPGMGDDKPGLSGDRDELSSLTQGHMMGRVYRVLSAEPVPVYDKPEMGSFIRARIKPGELVVAFDTPGKMRQVNTAREVFGYIRNEVKLELQPGLLPQEVYDPQARAAAEELLVNQAAVTPEPAAQQQELAEQPVAPVPQAGLTRQQVWIAIGFSTVIFAGTTVLLFVFVK